MIKETTQEQRLDYLVEEFKTDSGEYKDLQTPALEKDLADCYRNTLDMCIENGLKSVAFCCISTGVFHFPNRKAAEIAVCTVKEWITAHPETMERVIFNVFKDEDRTYYEELVR